MFRCLQRRIESALGDRRLHVLPFFRKERLFYIIYLNIDSVIHIFIVLDVCRQSTEEKEVFLRMFRHLLQTSPPSDLKKGINAK